MVKTRILILVATAAFLSPVILHAQSQTAGLVEGKVWYFNGMANSPGLCVIEVDRWVVNYRVECTQPGSETVLWEGLPSPGDYIDTLGANWVKVQAFYSFPPGIQKLIGFGVHAKHAEYPPQWTREQRLRKTNTIRTQNPNWDFTFRDGGMSFSPCIRRGSEASYRITGPWTGPRFDSAACKAAEGDWDWFNGGHVHLGAGGAAKGTSADGKESKEGRWKCLDPRLVTVEIQWAKGGWRDTLRLKPDGNRLEGENQNKGKVWGVRSGVWPLSSCRAVVDTWTWFNGGTIVLGGQGGARGYDRGSDRPNPGQWRCVNGSPVTIQIQWVKGGWLDTLTLSGDGRRLEGRNQQNSRVWGERK